MSRTIRTLVLSLAVLALLAGPAAAHITANPNTADGPSPYFKTSFRVGHGCEGSPTAAVRVSIPEGLTSIHPQEVVSFDIEIVREELAEPARARMARRSPTGSRRSSGAAVRCPTSTCRSSA